AYAEPGPMLPHAGREYVYLRQAYGELAAFLFGWMRFVVAGTGSIAILGVGFATFLSAIFPMTAVWASSRFTLLGQTIDWQFGSLQIVGVGAIAFFAVINCLTVAFGGRVQSLLTVLKLGGIAAVVVGVFVGSGTADWSHLTATGAANSSGASAFGLAMLAAWAAYRGWTHI